MSNDWNDFNSAQSGSNIIPKGTLAKGRMTLRPGGYNDTAQGWTDGWARRADTGSIYLDAEFTVLEGPYARRKVWFLIGLYSPKGPEWADRGRALIRGILNSSRGVSDRDNSPEAQMRRRINGLGDLNGAEFVARIDVGQDSRGEEKNEVRVAITPDHRDYAALMGAARAPFTPPVGYGNAPQPVPPGNPPGQPGQLPGSDSRPSWAK